MASDRHTTRTWYMVRLFVLFRTNQGPDHQPLTTGKNHDKTYCFPALDGIGRYFWILKHDEPGAMRDARASLVAMGGRDVASPARGPRALCW